MLPLGSLGCAIVSVMGTGGGGLGYFIEDAYERRKR
jgi:hypothetical protein